MAELKTQATDASVADFLATLPEDQRADAQRVLAMMQAAAGAPPVMWGSSIVGFGRYRYRYASGRTVEWFLVGFSPRKRDLTLYIMPGFSQSAELMARLGKHRTGRSCLYIRRLADVDEAVLGELITGSVAEMRSRHDAG
jgi:hypothetical protein